VLEGHEPATESFRRPTDTIGWHLEAIVDADGEEYEPAGGGVDMVELHLPVRHLLQETRLQHALKSAEKWRCSEWMARHLVEEHSLDRVDSAESVLVVDDYHDRQRDCMKHPAVD
jgi:hypothetical protein